MSTLHKISLIGISLICISTILVSGCKTENTEVRTPMVETADGERSFGEYTVRFDFDEESTIGSVEILKNGKQVYRQESFRFWIVSSGDDSCSDENLLIGTDITGDGVPNLVIGEFTGGAHSDYYAHVFEIGDKFRKVDTFAGIHTEVNFVDMDGDGRYEVRLMDWTFAYWHTCFAESPATLVILRWDDGKYQVATDLMRGEAIPAGELRGRAESIRQDYPDTDPPSELWQTMLDLIYTGHADKAYEFFDAAWPTKNPGKAEFLSEFREQLESSPYWPSIRTMNESKL